MSVFGVFKEVITVGAAVLAGDSLSAINVLGLALCISGNALYFCRCTHLSLNSGGWLAVAQDQGTCEEEGRLVILGGSAVGSSTGNTRPDSPRGSLFAEGEGHCFLKPPAREQCIASSMRNSCLSHAALEPS